MANDLEFENKKVTIFDLLKSNRLPIVVRVCEEEREDDVYDYYYARISGKTEVFLQKSLRLKYVLIKVLRYYDNDVIQKKNGPEYVLEHDTYVDKKFYIPVKYNGSFKFAHRPGSWRRYATVSQVLNELPRYISLGEATEATSGSGQKVTIPAKTKLELRQKFKDPHDGSVLLDCSDGNMSFSFSSTDRINCTAAEDPRTYHLFEHVRNKMLPKVILFENVALQDGVLMDDELNSALLTSVEGPIELLGFEDIEVVVGWVRDKEAKTYKTVLIPSGLWNKLIVQEKSLYSDEDKENYIKTKYKKCGNTQFLETCLYWMYPDKSKVTWLRSPDFYQRTVKGKHMFEPITDDFQDSTDDEVSAVYEEIYEPPPPLPERKATVRGSHEHHKRAKEKKSLFHKVHKELLGVFKHAKHEKHPPKIPKRLYHYRSKENDNGAAGDASRVGFTKDTNGVSDLNNPENTLPSDGNRTFGDSSGNDIYEFCSPPESETSYDYAYMESNIGHFKAQQRPLPKPPETQDSVPFSARVLPAAQKHTKASGIEKKQPKYVSVSMNETSHLFQDNLTEEDFFQYSVMETAQCFKHCGLSDFADVCFKDTVDGSFFKNFNFEELKKEPFGLSSFHILKVKKMIFDGWRPKVFDN